MQDQMKMMMLVLVEMVKNPLMTVKMEKEKKVLEILILKVKKLMKKPILVVLVVLEK